MSQSVSGQMVRGRNRNGKEKEKGKEREGEGAHKPEPSLSSSPLARVLVDSHVSQSVSQSVCRVSVSIGIHGCLQSDPVARALSLEVS